MARHDWPRNHRLMPGPDGASRALTRLGRTVRAVGDYPGRSEPQHREEHGQRDWLRDVILGGQDGLVNILGIIAGGGLRSPSFGERDGADIGGLLPPRLSWNAGNGRSLARP